MAEKKARTPQKKARNTGSFGAFITNIRLKDERRLRQGDVADKLELSLSYYSDIEKDYRRPLNAEEMEIFAKLFDLTQEDKIIMYDLASRETNTIPVDVENYIMEDQNGELARVALRKAKEVRADEKMWRKFIWELEKKQNQNRGDEEHDSDEDTQGR
ncbi:MAG: helix-turn-helix domain-containing protein [Oscillospiraceae bacterium]|nr:helix-turn-helix domain-containing protein [Oscillospiraceae bacterium]